MEAPLLRTGGVMKKVLWGLILAAIVGAAFAAPASASTYWARDAVASSEFGNGGSGCSFSPDPSVPNAPCRPGVGVSGAGGADVNDATLVSAWSASQATGAPDTYPACGDIGTAWAPATSGTDPESLTALYAPTNATQVDVYETNVGGFVTSIDVLRPDGTQETVFSGLDTTVCGGVLSVPVSGQVSGVTIHTQAPSWEEIDAVALEGSLVSPPSPV